MVTNNLYFYDKFGYPYNFETNTDSSTGLTYNYYEVYIKPVSISLFDNENIFILEKIKDEYYCPKLNIGESLIFKWDSESVNEFFIYDVLNNGSEPYLNKLDYVEFNEVFDYLKIPFQINIAFSPSSEKSFEKTLLIYFRDSNGNETLHSKIYFYGEGLDEDERFRIHLENFGIKFNKTDALCLKDYDVNEVFPDWEDVNNIRKQLIVNKEEIFPYIGTYYGLKNFIDILGYKDIIDIKEYWKNIDSTAEYFNKYLLVSITDMLNDGKIDELNLVENNRNIKFDSSFAKTGFLALAYQFTKSSGLYDENGLPILENTSDFTPTEVFFKLNKLKTLLEDTILPVNVRIKDVIGEWSYFISFSTLIWHDDLDSTSTSLNINLNIDILPKGINYQMYDISTLFAKEFTDGLNLPIVTYNQDVYGNYSPDDPIYKNPYSYKLFNQKFDSDVELKIVNSIKDFYTSLIPTNFKDINIKHNEYRDDYMKPIACPVILSVNVDELQIQDLNNITFEDIYNYTVENLGLNNLSPSVTIDDFTGTFEDFITTHLSYDDYLIIKEKYESLNYTWERIKYLNSYEIEWYVKYIQNDVNTIPFTYTYRGLVKDMEQCPVFLPNVGFYDVSVKIYDFYGCASYKYDNKKIEVKSSIPEICALHIGDDKFNFMVDNLKNVKIEDFGTSIALNPKVNVIGMFNSDIDIDSSIIDVSRFINYIDLAEVYNPELKKWDLLSDSINSNIDCYGFGIKRSLRFSDFKNATIDDLFHIRPVDCILSSENLAGFYIKNAKPGDIIKIGGYNDYIIPSPSSGTPTIEWICDQLNSSDHPILSLFNYNKYPVLDYIDNTTNETEVFILASAKDFYLESFQYLDFVDSGNGINQISGSKYTFNTPKYGHDAIKKYYENNNLEDVELLSTLLPKDANTYDYLVDNNIMYVDNNTIQHGNVPVVWYDNYLNIQTCKIDKNSFIIPKYKHVFFTINNISSKKTFNWKLVNSDTNEEIINIKNIPVFVWCFQDEGSYSLTFETYDNNGNLHKNTITNFINVLNKSEYIKKIEYKLDNNI